MKIVGLIMGTAAVLLGGLWFLQGVGLVHLRPVLCVANCETLQGPSPIWAAIGFALAAAGVAILFRATRRARR